MGMCVSLFPLSDGNIGRLLRDPPQVWLVIAPDEPELHPPAHQEPQPRSFLGRLFRRPGARSSSHGPVDLDRIRGEGEEVGLDKAWHAIHYLLTGAAVDGDPPLNLLVAGGVEVGDVDVGYGPARVVTAAETRAAHEGLSMLDDATLRSRFDAEDMVRLEIYPEIWSRAEEEGDPVGYVMEHVQELRRVLARAAEAGFGLLIHVH